ncbi:hypothetical protein KCU98_g525, partial [Aureobasidium melanogenum]
MQNNTTTNKQAVRDDTQDNAPAASEPAGKPKSGKDLAVEELADYYANSKPPGRRYPVSMAADMLNNYIDGVAGDHPAVKQASKAGRKNNSDKNFTVFKKPALLPARACQRQRYEALEHRFDCRRTIHQELICFTYQAHWLRLLIAISPGTAQGWAAFSTDTNPNVAETRFTELVGLIESCVHAADDTPGCLALYCRFDDLRAAAASKTMFESALTTVSFTFVDHHEYFGHDHTNARA